MLPRVAVLLLLCAAVLVSACFGDDGTDRLRAGDVSNEELQALIPTRDELPAGFAPVTPSGGPMAVPTPDIPYAIAVYSQDGKTRLTASAVADGSSSIGDNPVEQLCDNWNQVSKDPCPAREADAPNVGEEATAFVSGPDPDGGMLYSIEFIRDGIRVGVGFFGTSDSLPNYGLSFIQTIDTRIQQLADEKLNRN